jgi:threonine dehydrogenase-like Zn-dependent dehydrogenase
MGTLFSRNITVSGGVAPARAYIAELLPDVLSGAIHPEIVFDGTFALEETPAAYAAMHERRVTKALLIP